jgi:hypothetical protein
MTADVANDDGRPTFVDEPSPQLDDARALLALGYVVREDPSSLGLDDPLLIGVLNGWIRGLERYVNDPPTTDAGWNAYVKFVKEILNTVYAVIGGGEADTAHGATSSG